MVEVDVVAGWLGAGKTSAIRHLLASRPDGERVAVVVNDFGLARVDPALLDGGEVREIAGACVCCTAPAGFVAAVGDLLDRADRILVEPTGLARPADLVDTLRRAPYRDRVRIGPLVVVVDPHVLASGGIPADALDQARLADVIVANRVDLATPDEVAGFRSWVAGLWPGPRDVHEVTLGRVPWSALAVPARPSGLVVLAPRPEGHGLVVRSWEWPFDVVFDRSKLLHALRGPFARAKGVLRTDEGVVEWHFAGGRSHETPSGWRRDSRLDVIVAEAEAERLDHVAAELEAARVPAEVLARRGLEIEVGTRSFDRDALQALPDGVPDVSTLVPGRTGSAARLREVLRAAGVSTEASVVVVARDGLTTPPTSVSALNDAVLVHSLGDDPLPDAQGGPFRLLVPGGTDACANVKGVVRLALRVP